MAPDDDDDEKGVTALDAIRCNARCKGTFIKYVCIRWGGHAKADEAREGGCMNLYQRSVRTMGRGSKNAKFCEHPLCPPPYFSVFARHARSEEGVRNWRKRQEGN